MLLNDFDAFQHIIMFSILTHIYSVHLIILAVVIRPGGRASCPTRPETLHRPISSAIVGRPLTNAICWAGVGGRH